MPFQVLIILFLLFALSRVVLRFKDRQIRQGEFIFWAVIFVIAILGISFPFEASRFANFLGIGRGVDLVVYVSIAVLFYLVFRLYVLVEDTRREITEVIRQVALRSAPGKPKRK